MLRGRTMKAPPPADSTMMARNLGLTAQKVESHDDLDTLMLSKHWSLFSPVPYTCRNLLERTTRKDILLDVYKAPADNYKQILLKSDRLRKIRL